VDDIGDACRLEREVVEYITPLCVIQSNNICERELGYAFTAQGCHHLHHPRLIEAGETIIIVRLHASPLPHALSNVNASPVQTPQMTQYSTKMVGGINTRKITFYRASIT